MKVLYLALMLVGLLLSGCGSNEKELHVYSWGDYINPEVIKDFEKEYDCRVIVDTYDSNESMYAKLKAGASGYDIIFPSNYFLDLLEKQGMLQPIQIDQVPNLKNLDTALIQLIKAEVKTSSVPYMVTFTGLGYRQDRIHEMIDSWDAFGQVKWRGRMTMLNDFRETLGAGLKYLGYSVNTTNESEIEAAADQVIKWKKNLAKFESEQYKNGIATAEFLVVHGYCGDILQVMQEDAGVNFLYPKEGALIACDYLAIPKKAREIELAHHFIDYLYEPEVAARNMKWTLFLSPNKEAYAHLQPYLRNNPVLFPSNETLRQAELIQDIGEDVVKYYRAWDRVKSE
jgi:spermidine/putrescine transport system substrate-binding protein